MSNPSTIAVALDRKGKLTLYNGAVDIGQGSNTVMAQIAADALGLPVNVMRVVMGDTALTADAGKTSASRQTFISRSEEHTSELQSLMRISYAVFCLKKKKP